VTESCLPESVHTASFPPLLRELGISLAVSTYQAGKLIFVREDGDTLNTHFRNFCVPMGLAYAGGRLAVGTKSGWSEFHEVPSLADKIEPLGAADVVFAPRLHYHTGAIAVHEVAFGDGGELWAVNTRFSCLCTFDRVHSFVPQWRPPFIGGYSPDDRCHLNGLCLVEGKPKFVTALGTTDRGGAWRERKVDGGILMDVPSRETVVGGLSMPHSPRFHDGALWFLESGRGSLSRVDISSGKTEVVALLPGFTRGLDFRGGYAFIGLSQVRESNLFSGLPITQRLTPDERTCGITVVHLGSGRIVAFLKFTAGVQEIFSVIALPHLRPDLLEDERDERLEGTYILPDDALRDVQTPADSIGSPQPIPRVRSE